MHNRLGELFYNMADMNTLAKTVHKWLRRRIRMCFWKQWRKVKAKHDNLVKLGIAKSKAWEYANTRKSYWHTANSTILARTLTNEYLKKIGFVSTGERYLLVH